MIRLRRHRSLLLVVGVVLALGGALAPALAAAAGHCADASDPHCSTALAAIGPIAGPTGQGILQPSEPPSATPLVVLAVLKVPLAA